MFTRLIGSGLAGYQRQSADVLQSLANQFNSVDEIPILSELFSKMLEISAEKNFETVTPGPKKCNQSKPFFSAEHKMAYKKHEHVCKEGGSKAIQKLLTTQLGLRNLHPSVIYRKLRVKKSQLKPDEITMT